MPDVDRLLARIGLTERPAADLDGLRTVHRAYLTRLPYETLHVHLDEYTPLDLDALQDRVTTGGRGGYCFELNGLLAWLLQALGFGVERREALVGPEEDDGPTNHLALVVSVPGQEGRWLADAGLGEGWIDPLLLVPGVQVGPGRLGWTLLRRPGAWWIGQHPWGGFAGVLVRDPPVTLDAFAPHHERLSCHPDSSFRRALVLQRPGDDAITTLRARTLTVRGPERDDTRMVEDRDAFATVLRDTFGVDPGILGEQRLERLWAAACAQHAAWERATAP